jgi:hypothetical protein
VHLLDFDNVSRHHFRRAVLSSSYRIFAPAVVLLDRERPLSPFADMHRKMFTNNASSAFGRRGPMYR